MSRRLAVLACCLLPLSLPAAAPPVVSPTAHGDRLRDDYFRRQARRLGAAALADVHSRADWERQRPELHRQFLDMMGLWPLPPRTDLKATITGTVEEETFRVEKLHYQSIPGLYVTANLYLPKKITGPCPAVLYVCGHGPTVIDGVPYGNKVTYQHHGRWFAENGYVCLIVDTLQMGEVAGLHHGTHRLGMWWWLSLGYTPAGIELWNGMRGIDYLVARKEVDPARLGVTGRSGGGATSWWIGAADERVKCIVPVAGIADLFAHVSEGYPGIYRDGVVAGHCDCMYMLNTYRWDYTTVIALCAPRAVLLGNSDEDLIFPIPGYRRMTERIRSLYALLGVPEKFALLETHGPHKDTPPLRQGAFRWMNRWLKGDTGPISDPERPKLAPKQLKVFDRLPSDAINGVVHERFHRPASIELPKTDAAIRAWWPKESARLKQALLDRCFRGWPTNPPPLDVKQVGEQTHDGIRVTAYDYVSEEGLPLRLWLVRPEKAERPTDLLVDVVDEGRWREWLSYLGPAFRDVLYGGMNAPPQPYPADDPVTRAQFLALRRVGQWVAIIAPRGVGPTRWSEVSRFDGRSPVSQHIRRRFYLLGQTLDGQRVWDVRRAVAAFNTIPPTRELPLTLSGQGERAGIALYAALFGSEVAGVELRDPPVSHRQGPTFLNVLTVLDLPQAVALMADRKVEITVADEKRRADWAWPLRLQQALGGDRLKVTVRQAE